jgi:hypothetical protein
MSSPIVIASLDKNRAEQLRVALDEFRGHRLLDLRVTVELTTSSGIQTPTKKGVSVGVHMIPELRLALAEAEAQARERGWLQ